jgi:hypothetical protein
MQPINFQSISNNNPHQGNCYSADNTQGYELGETDGHLSNLLDLDGKKTKGKPKTLLYKYHAQCYAMMQKNLQDIRQSNCKREK